MNDIKFAFKFFLGVAFLFVIAWVLLGFPEVERRMVNGQMCDRIDSEFLRNLDLGALQPEKCGEAGIETWFKGLVMPFGIAFIFMFIREKPLGHIEISCTNNI